MNFRGVFISPAIFVALIIKLDKAGRWNLSSLSLRRQATFAVNFLWRLQVVVGCSLTTQAYLAWPWECSALHNWNLSIVTDTSDWRLDMVWAPSNILIFQVENEIIDFGSDLLSSEEYSLNKLDNVVFSLSREKCLENKQFSLSRQISIHVHSPACSRSQHLNKIIQHLPTSSQRSAYRSRCL